MAYSIIRFPVQCAKAHDEVNLALRIAIAYELRNIFRKKIADAVAAGVDKDAACTKLGFVLSQARKASRLFRQVPPAVVQWSGFVEYHRDDSQYPRPIDETVGSFNAGSIIALPANVTLIDVGSIQLVGTAPSSINVADVAEVRIERTQDAATGNDVFHCIVVTGRPEGGPGQSLPMPQPTHEVEA